MSTCASALGGIDYQHLRKLACMIIRMSGSGSLVYQSRTMENTGVETRGARSIRMRLISPVELIAFPESSRTSRYAHRSRGFQSKSIKEKSLHWNNRCLDLWRDVKDKFATRLKRVLIILLSYGRIQNNMEDIRIWNVK